MRRSLKFSVKPRRLIAAAILLLLPFVLPGIPTIRQIDSELVDLRAELSPRAASGRFIFAAIDKESLEHIGVWPWPRSVHSKVLDELVARGASDIFLDVDFSTASSPSEDQELAAALARAGGGVLLPVFEQTERADDSSATTLTQPISLFADLAWPVAANVVLDDQGQFWSFSNNLSLNGEELLSAAEVLAGAHDQGATELQVDFSIDPATVDVISITDLLMGKIAPQRLDGRAVVVGAYASELKDLFPVPIYGVLAGPMLHILAAETLLQNRLPQQLPVWPSGVLLTIVIMIGIVGLRTGRARTACISVFLCLSLIELIAYVLQKEWSLHLGTTSYHLMLAMGLGLLLSEKVNFSSWLLEVADLRRRNTRRILARVISDSADAVIVLDGSGRIVELSRTAMTFLGTSNRFERGGEFACLAPAPLVGLVDRLPMHSQPGEKTLTSARDELVLATDVGDRHFDVIVTTSRLELDEPRAATNASLVRCLTVRDITARKMYEAKLRRLAQLDDLTGAFNRREFVSRVNQSLQQGVTVAVGIVDLHRFATINATVGRLVGDQLLCASVRRLMAGAQAFSKDPACANVGRLGADVFAIAVAFPPEGDLATFPQSVVELFNKPLDALGSRIQLDVRVGVCLATERGGALASVEAAELALDAAKAVGGSGWQIYDPVAAARQARLMRLERDMRAAFKDGQFFLLYQPQVELASGRLVGAEALMRWKHPDLGLVSPIDFIGVAEANGFICDLGRWALEEACSAATSWPRHLSVAVNVSALQFAKGDLCSDAREALTLSGLEPHRLHIEVTETAFLVDPEGLLRQVSNLKSQGIGIALDDFGTGYSSLAYISRFPFDKIKIDQSFVRGISHNPAHQAIVRAVQSLAMGLNMITVCEGIEENGERSVLAEFGCQQGQGYLFGKPQTSEQLSSMEATGKHPIALV
ncbi:EAL domain-containing protein [Neorhizobium sp. T786]|uniref:EAL domain-containing protein n=1 Tax=Pseudorhizobium xiangyangii TaxID=2883104 RepID=UPI001CFFE1FB|nr:EAL domain-containing protein [Neorhizobium xiangyangii]MCB5204705.1 EAL domain-containing protein [Neorhizobium xiangyangii]